MVLAVPGTTLPPLGLTTNFIISIFSIYFLHSFFCEVEDQKCVIAYSKYDKEKWLGRSS